MQGSVDSQQLDLRRNDSLRQKRLLAGMGSITGLSPALQELVKPGVCSRSNQLPFSHIKNGK